MCWGIPPKWFGGTLMKKTAAASRCCSRSLSRWRRQRGFVTRSTSVRVRRSVLSLPAAPEPRVGAQRFTQPTASPSRWHGLAADVHHGDSIAGPWYGATTRSTPHSASALSNCHHDGVLLSGALRSSDEATTSSFFTASHDGAFADHAQRGWAIAPRIGGTVWGVCSVRGAAASGRWGYRGSTGASGASSTDFSVSSRLARAVAQRVADQTVDRVQHDSDEHR